MPGIRSATRRTLSRRVSVGSMIEFGLWMGIPYVTIGLAWTFFHLEDVARVETLLNTLLPAGTEFAAYLVVTALWPVYLLVPSLCAA